MEAVGFSPVTGAFRREFHISATRPTLPLVFDVCLFSCSLPGMVHLKILIQLQHARKVICSSGDRINTDRLIVCVKNRLAVLFFSLLLKTR